MSPADQEKFFAGAVVHGNLAAAFWEVATDADSMRGDHEQYTKLAFERAVKAAVEADRKREPIEVHLNTRDCEPMQPETAEALARVFRTLHEQYSRRA